MKIISCKYCGKDFKSKNNWQQYCSDRCRNHYWQESNSRQKSEFNAKTCYYCGQLATTIDHVPPQSARIELHSLGLTTKFPFFEVGACKECNSALGARGIWTLAGRKRYIKAFLQKKYKKYLRIPDWDEAALKELGDTLRDYTLSSIIIRNVIRNRLRW